MSNGLNKVLIIGNLGADPDVKFTQAGSPVANLSVATVSYTHLTLPTKA